MRIFRAVLFVFLAVGLASAQSHFGSVGGFGNVVFPGIGHAPAVGNPWGNVVFPAIPQNFNAFSSVSNPFFANRLGGLVTGFKPYRGGEEHRRGGVGGVLGTYAVPVYVGSDQSAYGYGYGYPPDQAAAAQQPNVTVVYPPPQPPVVINQNFAPPTSDQGQGPEPTSGSNLRMYQAPAGSTDNTTSGETSYYLIAFKDHTIYSAVAYYVEGDTLHYFTSGNVHNQASLSLVDRPLTEQLNRERNVTVQFPK
jgi:hypothetical protein